MELRELYQNFEYGMALAQCQDQGRTLPELQIVRTLLE